MQINPRHLQSSSAPTRLLINRIHQANSLAKIAIGEDRKRLYKIKTDGVLRLAEQFPECVWIDSLERQGDKWLFGVAGFQLGRLHLLVDNPFKIVSLIGYSPYFKNELEEELPTRA